MKVLQVAVAVAIVLSSAEAKNTKRKLIRGAKEQKLEEKPTEDAAFWNRQLAGHTSARKLAEANEDSEFWGRQLAGHTSVRKLKAEEDSEFWNRQLAGHTSARKLAENAEDDEFWQRALAGHTSARN